MIVRIELTYKTPKGAETTFSSNEMSAKDALIIAEDIEKTGRAKRLMFADNSESSWTMKELKKYMKDIQTEPHHVSVYFDGGFNRETMQSGLGCAIYYEQSGKTYRVRKNARVDELESNNEAEYAALDLALKELERIGVHHLPVKFIGDSQVVINQLSGEWPCYEENLSRWADRIESEMERLGIKPDYESVSRKANREADQLASQALKDIEIMSTIEI
ncbi:ribonuclease H family protein [Scopulibacillus cellulosilyticus]|uniref:Ribonuclease H family protein n=1 Tax=Scopulibacillus cellulosilyticus TaxID=2665665 RepID=A0ABW2PWW1_9BACL